MKIIEGDLLTNTSGILVHGCNCQGVMGSGIAGLLRQKYHAVFELYAERHRRQGLVLGDTQFIHSVSLSDPLFREGLLEASAYAPELPEGLVVVNAMTQQNYGRDKDVVYVSYDAVRAAFARVRMLANRTGQKIRFPMLGAGLANGKWELVEQAIHEGLGSELFNTAELWVLPGTVVPGHASTPTQLGLV